MDYLPVGFGAHHWVAYDGSRPVLFITLDRLEPKRRAEDLAAAYAGAVALRLAGLEFVLAPLPGRSGSPIVRLCGGALSCTPWRRGRAGGSLDVAWTSLALARLHALPPPNGIPNWEPLVAADFAAEVQLSLARPWGPGPYAQEARNAVAGRVNELARWTLRYQELAARAGSRSWVATHGEP